MTIIEMLKDLMVKVNMYGQMGNFNRNGNIKRQLKMLALKNAVSEKTMFIIH